MSPTFSMASTHFPGNVAECRYQKSTRLPIVRESQFCAVEF
jgi:hypothetical protein